MNNTSLQKLRPYLNIYKQYLDGVINKEKVEIFRKNINEPNEVIEWLEYFLKLDKEFPDYINEYVKNNFELLMFSPKWFKNKKWIGFWQKATGLDGVMFLNWLNTFLLNKEKFKDKDIEKYFIETHPNEKYCPYSVKMAFIMFKKYYEK